MPSQTDYIPQTHDTNVLHQYNCSINAIHIAKEYPNSQQIRHIYQYVTEARDINHVVVNKLQVKFQKKMFYHVEKVLFFLDIAEKFDGYIIKCFISHV